MSKKIIVLSLLAVAMLAGGGYGLYRVGMQQGMRHAPPATPPAEPAKATVDPSTWGMPEGQAATRRHIESGIKAGETDPVTGRTILYYHDPMVPGQKFDAPGKSPFMNMLLVPVYGGSAGAGADTGTVRISPRILQNLGVRTGEVEQGQLASEVSAAGAISWNERDQVLIQARAAGFVEKLHVRATLDRVAKGQAMFDIYVPDWVAAQEEYLALRRMPKRDLGALIDAARQRMRLQGMSDAQIALVERSGTVQSRITFRAPASGVITELAVREGSTVTPGMLLARVNDLSTVWAQAEVPESQAASLRQGSLVTASTPALPGALFKGKLQTLLPEVNPATRTRKARMELANPKGQLVPGMFVQMQLSGTPARQALLVPTEALIRTGKRTLVMLAEDNGAFRPVEVEPGIELGSQTEIRSGLAKGQKIVLSGQFLIDSEASLKGIR